MADERETLQTILQNLFPFIIPAKGLGLLPWRMRRGDRLTREGLFGRICCIFLVVVSSLMNIKIIWSLIKNNLRRGVQRIFNIMLVNTLNFVASYLVVIPEVYREFTDARTGLQIIESLAQYDRKVKQLGLGREDKFLFAWIIGFCTILTFLLQLTEFILQLRISIRAFPIQFGSVTMRLAHQLAYMKFCTIVHLLYQRYNHLNEIVLPKDQWRIRGNLAVNRRVVNMRDIVFLHSTLTRATKILAKVYSFELFVWVNSPIWEFILALTGLKNHGILCLPEAVQILVKLLSLCWLCQTTANEANKFALQILKTDPELIRARDINEELDAALYLYHNKISFRVWEFGEIDFLIIIDIASLTSSLAMIVLSFYKQ